MQLLPFLYLLLFLNTPANLLYASGSLFSSEELSWDSTTLPEVILEPTTTTASTTTQTTLSTQTKATSTSNIVQTQPARSDDASLEPSCFACDAAQCQHCLQDCREPLRCGQCSSLRVAASTGYAASLGATAFLIAKYGQDVLSRSFDSLSGFIALNGYESVLGLIALFRAVPPSFIRSTTEEWRSVALAIPVHGKDKDIRPSIESALRAGFTVEQIFVIENTGERYHAEESLSYQLCSEDQYREINYYAATWGSKSAAVVVASAYAERADYKYLLTIDDDVTLPENFDPQVGLLEGSIKMLAYPIRAENPDSLLKKWQDIEYSSSDMHHWAHGKHMLAPHGAISLLDIDFFLEHALNNPDTGKFHGEDRRRGMAITGAQGEIKMAGGPAIATQVPATIASLWSQRTTSWVPARHSLCCPIFKDVLWESSRSCTAEDLCGLGYRKLTQAAILLNNVLDVTRPCVFPLLPWSSWVFWTVLGATSSLQVCTNMIWQGCTRPYRVPQEELRPTAKSACSLANLSYPFYSIFTTLTGCWGAVQAWTGKGTQGAPINPGNEGYPFPAKKMAKHPEEYTTDPRNIDPIPSLRRSRLVPSMQQQSAV